MGLEGTRFASGRVRESILGQVRAGLGYSAPGVFAFLTLLLDVESLN
jgi:hypothetical protein